MEILRWWREKYPLQIMKRKGFESKLLLHKFTVGQTHSWSPCQGIPAPCMSVGCMIPTILLSPIPRAKLWSAFTNLNKNARPTVPRQFQHNPGYSSNSYPINTALFYQNVKQIISIKDLWLFSLLPYSWTASTTQPKAYRFSLIAVETFQGQWCFTLF